MNEKTAEVVGNILVGIFMIGIVYLAFFVYTDWYTTVPSKSTPIDPFWRWIEEFDWRT
jgi:hypothetical protein